MARPRTITADQVKAAAFEIVRREGVEALTARRVARELNCSTQPVFSVFGSMSAMREEVESRTHQFIEHALATGDENEPELLRLGLATLELARREPHIFRLASRSGGRTIPPPVLAAMRADARLSAVPAARLKQLHLALSRVTIGVAHGLLEDPSARAHAEAIRLLRYVGDALIEHEARLAQTRSSAR